MTISIRQEREGDREAIQILLVAAFDGPGEADLVDALRRDGALALSLVAESEGKIIGHIAFSPMTVTSADGASIRAIGLAPLAVAQGARRQGVGEALVHTGLYRLKQLGVAMVFLVGDAAYYSRFGFEAAKAAPFASPYAGPHFMAVCLDPALALPQHGRADYAPAFAALG